MSNGICKKTKTEFLNSYAALKSNHEVYYQMASIFKELSENEEQHADGILIDLLSSAMAEIPLEKSIWPAYG